MGDPHQVGLADNTSDLAALIDHDHAPEAAPSHQLRGVGQCCVPWHGDRRRGHDIRGHASSRSNELTPTLAWPEVRFRDDADRSALPVHDRNGSDPVLVDRAKQDCQPRCGTGDMNFSCHHVRDRPLTRRLLVDRREPIRCLHDSSFPPLARKTKGQVAPTWRDQRPAAALPNRCRTFAQDGRPAGP